MNLPEVANTSNTANATVEGTITWDFEGKETSEFATAECSEEIKDYVTGNLTLSNMHWLTSINFGGNDHDMFNPYEVGAIGNNKKETVWEALVQPNADTNGHSLSFDVNVAGEETTFKPTAVEMKLSRFMTGDKYADITFNTNKIGESILLERAGFVAKDDKGDSSDDYKQYGHFNYPSLSTDAATSHNMTVTINSLASNKGAGIGDVIITGTLTYPKTTVTLDEMATVHDLPAAENVTVEMKRGLTAGAWNTFCVPFSVSKDKLKEALGGSEVEIVEYTSQEGTTLYFTDTDKIVAGTPYLIKPASFSRTYSADMEPITFEGVDLVAADVKSNNRQVVDEEVRPSAADYSFVGTYVRYIMETDGTELGLNSKNKLAKPAASTNIMRGLRGFFRYNAGNGAGAKVVINGTLTSIDEIDGGTAGAKGVYHVSGRYVRSEWNNGSGLPRGLYIVNGQKMVK